MFDGNSEKLLTHMQPLIKQARSIPECSAQYFSNWMIYTVQYIKNLHPIKFPRINFAVWIINSVQIEKHKKCKLLSCFLLSRELVLYTFSSIFLLLWKWDSWSVSFIKDNFPNILFTVLLQKIYRAFIRSITIAVK